MSARCGNRPISYLQDASEHLPESLPVALRAGARDDTRRIFLEPGDYFVGGQDYVVRTMLGSCVAIVLWHPIMRFGAMSHFLLASQPGQPCRRRSGMYADQVMDMMTGALEQAGVAVDQCIAKVFGGGNMFPDFCLPDSLHVGRRNGEAALALVQEHGMRLAAEDLFGVGYRDITFDVRTGDVWVRHSRETS